MKKYNKGFTLIELLVVIAIIGILASIVLVSLNSARQKGRDASATGSISSFRVQAEIIFDSTDNTYTTICTTGANLLTAASTQVGGTGSTWDGATSRVFCNVSASGSEYAVAVKLLSAAQEFCVDSTGTAGKRTTTLGTDTVCPAL